VQVAAIAVTRPSNKCGNVPWNKSWYFDNSSGTFRYVARRGNRNGIRDEKRIGPFSARVTTHTYDEENRLEARNL
jgi:hypothetical protein